MDENTPSEDNLIEEFRTLGLNLVDALRAAWTSPERKRLQQEIEEGLTEMTATMRQEATAFRESPAGQRMQSDFEDLRTRVQSGEAEAKARSELLNALQIINSELKKASTRWSENERPAETPGGGPPGKER